MDREITTGAYWFYRRRFDLSGMNMELALDRAVDGAVLQAAAERVIKRYPCLKLTCVKKEDGTQYLLTETAGRFRVVENAGFASIEDPASNGYLWSLGYWENRLYLSVFHGLTDGLGLKLVFSMADEATYTSMLNMNHMLIRVPLRDRGASPKAGKQALTCVDERVLPDVLKG